MDDLENQTPREPSGACRLMATPNPSLRSAVDTLSYLHHCNRFLKKIRRHVYDLRRFLPGLKERHRLEKMIGPVGFWNELQTYQLNTLKVHGLKRHHTLLDIGCGPLQGGVAFINYLDKGRYTGLDISKQNLGAAYTQVARNSLQDKNPVLVHSDSFGERELGDARYDFIFASQILYYFDAEDISHLFKIIARRLKPDGLFLGDVIGPKHYVNRYPEREYHIHAINFIEEASKIAALKLSDGGELERYGYPSVLNLKTNILLRLRPSRPMQDMVSHRKLRQIR